MSLFYRCIYPVCRFIVWLLFSVRYEGLENLPQEGGYILAMHHISAFDPLIYVCRIKRQVHFMGKIELYKNPVIGAFLRALGSFPVDRGNRDTGALDHAEQLVQEGKIFGIFPEGTRSKTGKLLKIKSGAVYIAAKTGAAVVPAMIIAKDQETRGVHFRSKMVVRFGKVIPNEKLQLSLTDRRSISRASKTLQAAMESLMEEPV